MKIHSRFKDYYDSVQMHGQDETVHYVRNTEEIQFSKEQKDKLFKPTRHITLYYLEGPRADEVVLIPFVILFCGKVYKAFRLMQYNRYERIFTDLEKTFYDADSALEFYDSNTSKTRKKYYSYWNGLPDRKIIGNWLKDQGTPELEDYALKNKIATAYINIDNAAIKNPCLKDYEFFRVAEPYTAYQELDMYISGVLSKDPNMMVEISDKDRIAQHGFDKFSFRRSPQKK